MSTAGRYFHTLRYLRPGQVAARISSLLPTRLSPALPAPPRRPLGGGFAAPVEPEQSLFDRDVFRFLHVERPCRVALDWEPSSADRLWTYNLHYFDDLNARGAVARRAAQQRILERWIVENPTGEGSGWDAYPTSRRIVNWIKWDLGGADLSGDACASLATQARWLARHLEFHLLGNHLLANAKALIHAGLYFSGDDADAWRETGMRLLRRELAEQVLPDGGHFERSPMYHATVLEDLLDLVNLAQAYAVAVPAYWNDAIVGMRQWLQVMSHPDGEIAFFNDAAFGISPTAGELEAFALRLGLSAVRESGEALAVLQPSGYVRALAGPAWLLCDCAPVGPDYQPGHAHADTLSFELSLCNRRVLVNSGTSRYGADEERQRQRGTAAHNTVVVDGQDSSEVWAAFRVARRARVRLLAAQCSPSGGVVIHALHDGFRRLPGRNQHSRRWRLEAQALTIEDEISGRFGKAEAHLHLHPDLEIEPAGEACWRLQVTPDMQARISFEGARSVALVPGYWHPRFGVEVANRSLVAVFHGPRLRTSIQWGAAP